MKITSDLFENPIKITENKVEVIIIEHKKSFIEVIKKISGEDLHNSTLFRIYEEEKEISLLKDVEIIFNPFWIDVNDKRFLNKVLSDMESATKEFFQEEQINMEANILSFIERLMINSDVPIQYGDRIDMVTLLKATGVYIEVPESLTEKMCLFIELLSILERKKIIFLLEPRIYFDNNELEMIYKESLIRKIPIVVIESKQSDRINDFENLHIIDKDLCEIA